MKKLEYLDFCNPKKHNISLCIDYGKHKCKYTCLYALEIISIKEEEYYNQIKNKRDNGISS